MRRFTELEWESRFVEALPGDPERGNFVRQVSGVAYSEVTPTGVARPRLLGWAGHLGEELGIERPAVEGDEAVEVLGGNGVAGGMRPYAARYGGHQFGVWAGQLGDGRAITLGEVVVPGRPGRPAHGRTEFQLKGAGRTPYSRSGDGRAVLRSSMREFLCSEAMHFLGVPTTRALSLVGTGEEVVRDMFYDGNPEAEPGAVVCRVAPTFLRFGNFEILTAHGEHELLKRVADYLITEYYPAFDVREPGVYARLLDEIARRTAGLMVEWQRVGFVHGVMNTDNMSALGLTIDYGPYGWLEPYDPDWTPNTTDAGQRRYRFGNQPGVALWNVGRLGAALFPLIRNEERVQRALDLYRETFNREYLEMLGRKMGIVATDEDVSLAEEMFELMQGVETDYTIFFRRLSEWREGEDFVETIRPALYAEAGEELRGRWGAWGKRYRERVRREGRGEEERQAAMKRVNPKYVLRNYMAQEAIDAAGRGDLSVMERLMRVLREPYDEQPGAEDVAGRRPEWARRAPGCSALSCSS